MASNGYITQEEATRASQRGLGLKHGTRYIQRREPYFFDYVQEKLIERYGVGVVRRGGLRIHTTIDPQLQDQAREAINAYYADPSRPELGDRGDRPRQRQDPRDGVEREATRSATSTSPPRGIASRARRSRRSCSPRRSARG